MIYHTTGCHIQKGILKMEEAFPSEIIVTIFWATWHHIQKTFCTLKMEEICSELLTSIIRAMHDHIQKK
jgi:hypothetical protein